MPELIYPPKPKPGAAVAVVSPSTGLPGRFPEVYETGLARLRDLGLEPVAGTSCGPTPNRSSATPTTPTCSTCSTTAARPGGAHRRPADAAGRGLDLARPTDRVVEGALWGGNLEVLSWLLMAGHVGPNERYAGCVFAMETSEEMQAADEVYRILRSMGERSQLAGFPAVLVGWALAEYAPDAVVVYDLDIGHTDPQQILPYGGQVRVDATARRIAVRY